MNKEEAVSYIRNRIYRYIDVDNECTDEYIRERISREIHLFSKDNIISVNNKDYISKRVFDSIRGLDVLEEFLRDDCITDVYKRQSQERLTTSPMLTKSSRNVILLLSMFQLLILQRVWLVRKHSSL